MSFDHDRTGLNPRIQLHAAQTGATPGIHHHHLSSLSPGIQMPALHRKSAGDPQARAQPPNLHPISDSERVEPPICTAAVEQTIPGHDRGTAPAQLPHGPALFSTAPVQCLYLPPGIGKNQQVALCQDRLPHETTGSVLPDRQAISSVYSQHSAIHPCYKNQRIALRQNALKRTADQPLPLQGIGEPCGPHPGMGKAY